MHDLAEQPDVGVFSLFCLHILRERTQFSCDIFKSHLYQCKLIWSCSFFLPTEAPLLDFSRFSLWFHFFWSLLGKNKKKRESWSRADRQLCLTHPLVIPFFLTLFSHWREFKAYWSVWVPSITKQQSQGKFIPPPHLTTLLIYPHTEWTLTIKTQ